MSFFKRKWGWKEGAMALGMVFLIAFALVKPIGVSTQFVVLDGILWDGVNSELVQKTEDGIQSTNAYLNKSNGKYAKSVDNPLNYGFVFVLSMILGGYLAKKVSTENEPFKAKSFLTSFLGGFLVLFGARLAGGCTSGHMMSGMMQTSVSGYLFAISVFVVAIPTAIFIRSIGGK